MSPALRYEHRRQRLLTRREFGWRLLQHGGYVAMLLVVSLVIGTAGYMTFAHQSMVDSFLNASMLLGGMGPVGELAGTPGKIFASLFALYSGLVFMIGAGLLFAPILHRVIHRFHADAGDAKAEK